MTARDFTPTDEQVEALGHALVSLAPQIAYGRRNSNAVSLAAHSAFQSIIAAAKAEAWDEGAAALGDWHESPKGEWVVPERRPDIRQWVDEPAPTNPYREASA